MKGRGLGSLIGGVGGLVFVLVNAGELPAGTAMRGAAVVLFVATVVAAFRVQDDGPPPGRTALRTYGISVVAEVLAIPVGAAVLTRLGHEELVLPWVVLVLGAHFLPFSWAFGEPLFAYLGWGLITLAAVGAAFTLGVSAARGPEATATSAGFVLLAVSLYGALARTTGEPTTG